MNGEWEQMAEDIRRSLEAITRAHASAEALQKEPGHHTLQAYRQELQALIKELKTLDYLVHHEIEVAVEDIGDLLNRALVGRKAPYRHSPEIHNAEDE
ncbi:MAG TPA: hypothetical protein ENJ54_09170 [Chloroflexi bacterium]|nr:hypothetical protein [Chloroflexota bacterium]